MNSLVQLFELPEDESLLPDDHFIEVEDTPGYQAAYSKLAFAGRGNENSLPGKTMMLFSVTYDVTRGTAAVPNIFMKYKF